MANRIQKLIESGNLKLGQVASDALGASGRAILWALARGETDPAKLAALAQRQLKEKVPQLRRALQGHLTVNQRFVLGELLKRWEELETADARVTREIDHYLQDRPKLARAREILDTIPGIRPRVAEVITAEIGVQMEAVFASDAHWRVGPAYVQAIKLPAVNAFRAVRAKATLTCARPWCKRPRARPCRRTAI